MSYIYEGQTKDGLKHGYGRLYVLNQYGDNVLIYDGHWENDENSGFGCLFSSSTDELYYAGEFKNDQENGFGVWYYDFGGYYRGFFKNGVRDGKGIDVRHKSSKADDSYYLMYTGNFKKNMRDGYGKEYYPNGMLKFKGFWKKDWPKRGKSYDENGKLKAKGTFDKFYLKQGTCYLNWCKITGKWNKTTLISGTIDNYLKISVPIDFSKDEDHMKNIVDYLCSNIFINRALDKIDDDLLVKVITYLYLSCDRFPKQTEGTGLSSLPYYWA